MGNASESYLFVSRISKSNDFLMGTLYTIFGKLIVLDLLFTYLRVDYLSDLVCVHCLFHRGPVFAGEWYLVVRGLQKEVFLKASRVFRCQSGHQWPEHDPNSVSACNSFSFLAHVSYINAHIIILVLITSSHFIRPAFH